PHRAPSGRLRGWTRGEPAIRPALAASPPRVSGSHLRANDPCWCGEGRKFKRCHGEEGLRLRPGRLSSPRAVPAAIARPDYAETGAPALRSDPLVRSDGVIARMREAGRVAAQVLAVAGAAVAPDVTTDELDELVHAQCIAGGAYPSPLNYRGHPKSVCTAVNELLC